MSCPHCNAELQPGQPFCNSCGAAVPPPPAPGGFAPPGFAAPAPAAPFGAPPVNVVEQTQPNQWGQQAGFPQQQAAQQQQYAPTQQQPQYPAQQAWQPTAQQPVVYGGAAYTPPLSTPPPISNMAKGSAGASMVAIIAGVVILIASFLPMESLKSDAALPGILGDYKLNDLLFTNMLIAVIVAALCLIGGGVLIRLGHRVGAGLAGGTAVILVPFVVVVWGLCDTLSKTGEGIAQSSALGGAGGTFFQGKPGIGFWILVVGVVLAVVALLMGAGQGAPDGSPKLNPGLCAVGAIASVIAAIGQLVPQHSASFSDNWKTDSFTSNALVYGRLAMLAVIAIVGVIGFMRANRWGIGLALGSMSIYAWQWVSSIAGSISSTQRPAPPGFDSPGTLDGKPYIVTTIGVLAAVVVGAIALFIAST
ncbi:MAG TPA: zinc ribbon domain-containing protein, partial [Ilumatobacteraceae bacterium]